MSFINHYKQHVEACTQKVIKHPFFTEIIENTLGEVIFRFFVIQDAIYIRQSNQALTVLASKAKTQEDTLVLCEYARSVSLSEKDILWSLLADWKISQRDLDSIDASPECLLISTYINRIAHFLSYEESIAAMGATYWLFHILGQQFSPFFDQLNPLYRQWIQLYNDASYIQFITPIMNILAREGNAASTQKQAAMLKQATKVVDLEYRFFDSVYNRRAWPV